ncbi:hypothetical protein B0H12DRAFT_1080059 [Mycena haematopus]|nr:hypothetical protein B0H12DRAFT_1080059 [Mycena haematopus]
MARKHTRNYVPALHRALNAPPSPTDGPGGVYAFVVDRVVKVGKAVDPPQRRLEWARQCRGERQRWMDFYWQVPYAKKFERILHLELKCRAAWKGRVRCRFCPRAHQEKYDLGKCGGLVGFVGIAESRLGASGWLWSRHEPVPDRQGETSRVRVSAGIAVLRQSSESAPILATIQLRFLVEMRRTNS